MGECHWQLLPSARAYGRRWGLPKGCLVLHPGLIGAAGSTWPEEVVRLSFGARTCEFDSAKRQAEVHPELLLVLRTVRRLSVGYLSESSEATREQYMIRVRPGE